MNLKLIVRTGTALLLLMFAACSKSTIKTEANIPIGKKGVYNRQAADYYLRAMQHKEVGNLFGAVVEFQNAYSVSKDSYIQFEIAQCYYYLKQFDNAGKALELAIAENHDNEDLLYWQLKILQSEKNNSESVAVLDKLLKINPAKLEYYYFLMELEYNSGDYTKAESTARAAVNAAKTVDEKRDLYARLADLAIMQNKIDEAESAYREYLTAVDADDLVMLTQYSRVLFSHKKYNEAIEVQKKILDLDNDNIEQFNVLFLLQNSYGSKKEAELTLLNSVKKFNDPDSKLNLGRFYAGQKDTLKARVIYQSLLKKDSGDVNIYTELAGMYDNIGDKQAAVAIYQQAYMEFPDNHSILNNYAYLLSEISLNLDFALAISKKSLDKDPDSPSYLDTFGWINYKLGNYSEAEKYILKAIEKDTLKTQVYVLYEHLGDVQVRLDKKNEALEWYRKAMELNPQPAPLEEKIRNIK